MSMSCVCHVYDISLDIIPKNVCCVRIDMCIYIYIYQIYTHIYIYNNMCVYIAERNISRRISRQAIPWQFSCEKAGRL